MDKTKLLQFAKFAHKTGRYEECANYMSKLVREQGQLDSVKERNMLMMSYKKVVEANLTSLKALYSTVQEDNRKVGMLVTYREKVEDELYKHCSQILYLLDEFLISEDCEESGMENLVYYMKMKADFLTYYADIADRVDRYTLINQIKDTYEKAMTYSRRLPATNPIRLCLHLNTSVFLHEFAGNTHEAFKLASKAYSEAIAEIAERNTLREDLHAESSVIIDQIKDNITLWSGEVP